MSLTVSQSLLIVIIAAISIFITRVIPFILFRSGHVPTSIQYLGRILPPAVFGILIIYCLKGVSLTHYPHGLPEGIAILSVVLLQLWRRNTLLSIGSGTVLYMILVQQIFIP